MRPRKSQEGIALMENAKRLADTFPKAEEIQLFPPRQRHELVQRLCVAGMTRKAAMIRCGYTAKSAQSGDICLRKTWKELLDEKLPEGFIADQHRALLEAKSIDHYVFPLSTADEEIHALFTEFGFKVMRIANNEQCRRAYYAVPDNTARTHAIDMAYKLRQRYGDVTVRHELGSVSDRELEEELARVLGVALKVSSREAAPGGKPARKALRAQRQG